MTRLKLSEGSVAYGTLVLARSLPQAGVAITVALAALVAAVTALGIAFMVLTGAVVGSVPAAVRGGFDSAAGRRLLWLLAAAAAVFVAQQVLGPVRDLLAESAGRRLDARLRGRVIAAALRPVGIAHLEDPRLLDKVSLAQSVGVSNVTPGDAVVGVVNNAASRLQVIGATAVVALFHLPLALAIVACGLVARMRIMRETARWVSVVAGRAQALRRAHYFRDLALTPQAAKETRVFGMADWVGDRFASNWLGVMTELWRERKQGAPRIALWIVPVAGAAFATLVVAGRAAAAGEISLGELAVAAQAVVAAAAVYVTDNDLLVSYGAASIPAVRALEETASDPALAMTGSRAADDLPKEGIRFQSVSFRYPGRDHDVFSGLDLQIPAGRSLAVVGPNGAGKTTLVKLLARLYDPGGGRLSADGIDLRSLDPASWRSRIAVIFQDFVRYELSAADNVAVAGPPDSGALRRAAERAGALEVIERLPHGWDTVLSREYEAGAELSGGQWQRVALARALYAVDRGARVLVLDEPTASLDVRAEAELFDRFLELTKGLTTVLISHRFSSVRHADRIVVLEGGRVTEDGTHDQLMALNGRYAEMFLLQAERFTEDA